MCVPQDCQPIFTMRAAGRELDDLTTSMAQLAEMITATNERVGEHFGADATINDRAAAFLVGAGLMLKAIQSRAEALTDRMLHAAEI